MPNLESKRPLKLKFSTDDLLQMFNLPSSSDIDQIGDRVWMDYSLDDLLNTFLDIHQNEDGDVVDRNNTIIPDEAIGELLDGMGAAAISGSEARYYKEVMYVLEQCLETFQDYKYEYFSEQDFQSYSGVADGLVHIKN